MKKLFLLLPCLLLTACPYSIYEMVYGEIPEYIPKEIPNPECDFTVDGIKVFQVIDKGILARFIYRDHEEGVYKEYSGGDNIFYIPSSKKKLEDMYDDKIMNVPTGCFKKNGTYSYSTAMGSKNTIRKLKYIEPKYIPNPEYKDNTEEPKDLQKNNETKKPLPNVGGPGFME
ncbi:MAG: hypothetical protein JW985_03020 [Alphaproteobacteria bacterium]|nr:hypothetical protein [Alphaproteobacteria bacterium]